jgi:ketosteroid isomerase-like protein
MTEESTTPELVELVRKQVEALNRGDLDGVMSSVTEDVVLDGRVEVVEGRVAIRDFLEEWFGVYEELDFELEEVSHLGGGVVLQW